MKIEQQSDAFFKGKSGRDIDLLRERIGWRPAPKWLGDWIPDAFEAAQELKSMSVAEDALRSMVICRIPGRDCGQLSAGGAESADEYKEWIDLLAKGIDGANGIIILEPDSLGLSDYLDEAGKQSRRELRKYAIAALKRANAHARLDSANARWLGPEEAAKRLQLAGVGAAHEFALSIANAATAEESAACGDKIAELLGGGLGYVIDASRNGSGPAPGLGGDNLDPVSAQATWRNPPSQRLGRDPTLTPCGYGCNAHALLWIKPPGESDGECNMGPPAGVFSQEIANRLASVCL